MKIQHVFVVGVREDLRGHVDAAVKLAFPDVSPTAVENLSQVPAPAAAEGAIVLASHEALPASGAVTPKNGSRPTWPLVVLGPTKSAGRMDWVYLEDLTPPTLARALASAAEKHALTQEIAQLRGDLLTVARRVNHDLRSSLNGVVTATEVLKEILSADRPEDLEFVQPLADSTEEVACLIDKICFLARATAAPLPPANVNMDELVWKGLARVERRIQERHAHVTHADKWPMVNGVAAWIEVIWGHLIENAVVHGGVKPEIQVGWKETPEEFVFYVDDSGPGIPVEKRGGLFTPFHKLGDAGAVRGFGLSVVQRLVELQGGRCGYELRAEGGSRFYFTLPKNDRLPAGR